MSPKKVDLTNQELVEHLEEQLGFLRRSADAYDEGHHGEAKRMAVTIRILVHDTGASASLLGQLDRLGGSFFSTAAPHQPENISTHGGLVFHAGEGSEARYVAMLDVVPYKDWLPFKAWWEEPVFVDDQRVTLTRRDLVLTAANQDGGAHVDPALDETYRRLAKENSLGWKVVDKDGEHPIPLAERAAIRQIAHEVLRTLNPKYRKEVEHQKEVWFGGAMVFDSPIPPRLKRPPEIPRNRPCPCGSGEKYKKCHGAPT